MMRPPTEAASKNPKREDTLQLPLMADLPVPAPDTTVEQAPKQASLLDQPKDEAAN
jgi:hypothetical protein